MPINSQFKEPQGEACERTIPNPATASPHITGLFPPGVAAAQLEIPGDPSLLRPEEFASVARAVQKRVEEFAAGRLCARHVLADLGIVNFPLRVAPDRAPVWPESIVGSITHTTGFCAAVAARRHDFVALGLDVEVVDDLKRDLWPHICVAAETAWLESLPARSQGAAAALIFSAKEAFYKCQYPVTGERLSFGDLCVSRIDLGGLGGGVLEGQASILPTRPLALAASSSAAPRGRYRLDAPYVSVGVWLPAFESLSEPTGSIPRRAARGQG